MNCRNGAANTPVLAPRANERVNQATPAHRTMPRAKAGGQTTAKPPANVSTLRPPRSRAKTGHAWPAMAAATAAYTRTGPGGAPAPSSPWARRTPSSPAAVPFSVSPASTGTAATQPSWSFMFQKPGFRSPTWRGSNPRARAASTATGTEPSR